MSTKLYREKHRIELTEKQRKYYQDHKEKCLTKSKKYYLRNKKKINSKRKQTYHQNPEPQKERSRSYYHSHRKEALAKSLAWRKQFRKTPMGKAYLHKEYLRRKKKLLDNKLKKLGSSFDKIEKMKQTQNNLCAICNLPEKRKSRWSPDGITALNIDHDHATNRVRGLLCHKCNVVLGLVHDDITILKKMISYLMFDHCTISHSLNE